MDGGVSLIEDEEFDFDVPISPTVCDVREVNDDLEDECEVFFGPIGHKERCVTVHSYLQDDDCYKPLSPLNGEQIAELFKEATAVSLFIKSQSQSSNANECHEKESGDICNMLSTTFTVEEDQSNDYSMQKPDQENGLSKPLKSEFSPETLSEDNSSQPQFPAVIHTTPSRVLRESNSQDQPNTLLPSPFTGWKACPVANVSKFSSSKLPKTQMTLKTRSCFNSPIKVEHVYGILNPSSEDDNFDKVRSGCNQTPTKIRESRARISQGSNNGDLLFTELSKLPVPSQSGVRLPGFSVKPRRHRTSSTSSLSSTSSVLSGSNPDLNETFTISDTSVSDVSLIPSSCARKVPATKVSLKPLTGNSVMPKKALGFTKPKGRPQPVKALLQPGNVTSKKAPQTSRSLGSTPGKQKGSLGKPETPFAVQRSKSFTTPKTSFAAIQHQRSSLNSEQFVDNSQTPSSVKRSKSFTTQNTGDTVGNRSGSSTGQSIKTLQTPSKGKNPELPATPRRRSGAKATPRKSLTAVPTPVRRRGSAVEASTTSKAGLAQVQTRSKVVPRPTTPDSGSCVSHDVKTPANQVPSKVIKRKSLSAGGQKRHSLLPIPLRSNKNFGSQGALSFNMSPAAEPTKSRTAKVEPLQSNSRLSDPFSPLQQSFPADPVMDYTGGDLLVTNLIELSPTLPAEGNLIDI